MVYMYMSFVFFLKNKVATPVRRCSAAFTALQQEPCLLSVVDMQHEGKGLDRSPNYTAGEAFGGSAKAERAMADQSVRGLKSQAASLSRFCSSED